MSDNCNCCHTQTDGGEQVILTPTKLAGSGRPRGSNPRTTAQDSHALLTELPRPKRDGQKEMRNRQTDRDSERERQRDRETERERERGGGGGGGRVN